VAVATGSGQDEQRETGGLQADDRPERVRAGRGQQQRRSAAERRSIGEGVAGQEHEADQAAEGAEGQRAGGGRDPRGDGRGHEECPEEIRVALDALAGVEDETVAADQVRRVAERDVGIVDGVVAQGGGSNAVNTGLEAGDIIRAIDRTPLQSTTQFRVIDRMLKSGDPVVLQVERSGKLQYLAFEIE